MKALAFQVLEGMERGRVLENLFPPITIGREEDNGVQLNDERESRFHAVVKTPTSVCCWQTRYTRLKTNLRRNAIA